MVFTAVLVACLLGGAVGQDSTIGRIAYMQLMSACLGETSYREYLESVAAARRECGDVGGGGFTHGFGNVPLSPSLAAHFGTAQPGLVLVQNPGTLGQLPGVLGQHSQVIPQRPNLFATQRPGGIFGTQQAGLFGTQQPGILSTQTGLFTQQPTNFFQSPAFLTQSAGVTNQPGIFPDASALTLLSTPSSSNTAAFDSLPLIPVPVGPSSFRGVREKRQAPTGLPDIQQTREHMQALVNNFTCVLTKLAVVQSNLDLNHKGLINSVVNLPVATELKEDLVKSIDFCRDLTRCLPLDKQQLSVPRKLQRIMDYVKCEKEMRLKACHKHNLRQNLQNLDFNRLPLSGSRSRRVEEVVNLIVDAQSAHELELI